MEIRKMYRIGEVASAYNLTLRTLRFWEQSEIIKPTIRVKTMRLYSEDEIEVVKLAIRLKNLMFSIKQRRHIVSRYRTLGKYAFKAEFSKRVSNQIIILKRKEAEIATALKDARAIIES